MKYEEPKLFPFGDFSEGLCTDGSAAAGDGCSVGSSLALSGCAGGSVNTVFWCINGGDTTNACAGGSSAAGFVDRCQAGQSQG